MKKTLATIIITLSIFASLRSQQLPKYSFFEDNMSAINPALPRTEFMYEDYSFFLNATYRNQWVGFEHAPKTFLFQAGTWLPDWSANNFFQMLGNTQAGLDIVHDETGPFSFSGVYGRLGHLIYLNESERTFISGGLSVGLNMQRIKLEVLSPAAQADPYLQGLSTGTSMLPDAGAGIAFAHYFVKEGYHFDDSQGIYFGVSVPQVLGLNVRYRQEDGTLDIPRVRHYNAVLGGQIGPESDNFRFRPTFIYKYVPKGLDYYGGSIDLLLKKRVIVGFGANSNPAISGRAGFYIPMEGPDSSDKAALRVGFNYTWQMNDENLGSVLEFTATYMIDYQN